MVLVNGEIVIANETTRADLFWALKGGNNNFGIVTSVTIRTYPLIRGWGGMVYYTADHAARVKAAVEHFMKDGCKDPKAGIVPVWVAKTDKAPAMVLVLMFYTDPVPFPESLKVFADIPAFKSSLRIDTLYGVIKEHTNSGYDRLRCAYQVLLLLRITSGSHHARRSRAFVAGTVMGAPETVSPLVEAVFEAESIKEFVKLPNITIAQALQPVTSAMLSAGSHALDLSPSDAPYICEFLIRY